MIRVNRALIVGAAIAAVGLFLTATLADASILMNWQGNTFPEKSGNVDGHVNFAVYDSTLGGVSGDVWGTGLATFDSTFRDGSGTLDTNARYLYLYQTVNDHTGTAAFNGNSVGVSTSLVTSYGLFTGTGFTEAGVATKGSVVANLAGGVYLGGMSAVGGDPGAPYVNTLGTPGVALNALAINPSSVTMTFTDSGLAQFNFVGALPNGQVSSLWGFTSNQAPLWGSTSFIDGGGSAQGAVPTVSIIPEPATVIVWSLLGLGWVGGMQVMRRRRASVLLDGGPKGRTAWTEENRVAIRNIVDRSRSRS